MRELLLRNRRYFLILGLAALAFRLFFVLKIPVIAGDSFVYADIAKNLLNHHVFGLSNNEGFAPTLIRLPGYPLFLAAVFKFFGQDNWRAIMVIQALFDVGTCFVVTAIARRCVSDRAGKIAFALAAFCPFIANYTGTPLTETLSLFFIALALLFAVIGFGELRLAPWIGCGVAVGCAIQLRPDGGWLLGAIGFTLLLRIWVMPGERRVLIRGGLALVLISLAPLVPWTIRNWRTFGVFQPLVTVAASDPGEWVETGWPRWLSTWVIDYSASEDLGFKVSGETISMDDVPERAFSDAQEKMQVADLFARYNATQTMTPELDAEFAQIAARRIHEHPLRHYVTLPLARLTSIWLRPRTEMLPFDTHWWRFDKDLHDSLWATSLLILNLAYVVLALRGILHGPPMRFITLLLSYLVIRSLFLMMMGVTEDRYTLECYPCLIILAARYMAGWKALQPAAVAKQEYAHA